jgi:RimJ/RimL family protein N-acetyltransferase
MIMAHYIIKTERLGLRNWQTKDIVPTKKMNSDKAVMEFFPTIWSQKQTEDFIQRMRKHFRKHEFCYFAVDELETGKFIGFIGLMNQTYNTSFAPFVDMGWRLIPEVWGQGFASEGARACLDFAFEKLNIKEVYAIAPELNKKSQKIMQKLGLHQYEHFSHPKIDIENPLCKCVAYKIAKE